MSTDHNQRFPTRYAEEKHRNSTFVSSTPKITQVEIHMKTETQTQNLETHKHSKVPHISILTMLLRKLQYLNTSNFRRTFRVCLRL